MNRFELSGVFAALAAALLLAGCATSETSAPISDRSAYSARHSAPVPAGAQKLGAPRDSGRIHTVAKGDTIYNISLRYGLDSRQLAVLNDITDPTQLSIGRELRLPESVTEPRAPEVNPEIRVQSVTDYEPMPEGTTVAAKPAPAVERIEAEEVKTAETQTRTASALPAVVPGTRFLWPARGEVISDFAKNGMGLDISGVEGDIVVAAGDGEVIFVGDTVKGYGQLVIVKHAPTIVTAYGHNSKIVVKRGERVKAGQKIAELGKTEAQTPRLRFEVRDKGKPVDPTRYLSARR